VSQQEVVWYPSKVDRWLGAILVLLPLIEVVVLAIGLTSGNAEDILWGLIALGFIVLLYVLVVLPVRYGITDRELIIRFGVIRQRVPLAQIAEVRPTRSPLASPALSMDRLAIRTGKGFLPAAQISPAHREEFLATLAARAGLRQEGDRLVRISS
jgi:uncharacterized membrane protein YdbT with pleckstrin-like domain